MHRLSFFAAAMLVAITHCALAQSTLGSISGTAQDATGAKVPNANVRLRRTESNTDRTVTTDSGGSYTTLNLEPGRYDITIEAAGLASTTAIGIALESRQQLRYDFTLKAGSLRDIRDIR